jgi:hypothetical protein
LAPDATRHSLTSDISFRHTVIFMSRDFATCDSARQTKRNGKILPRAFLVFDSLILDYNLMQFYSSSFSKWQRIAFMLEISRGGRADKFP